MVIIKFSKRIIHSREWAIEEIKVHVVNEKTAWIEYEKYVVNAERHRIIVKLNWFDRRKGNTLKTKIGQELNKLKIRLEDDNRKIREYKLLEKSFTREEMK